MNILEEVKSLLDITGIPIETGVFDGDAPERYIVLIPMDDEFPLCADDFPQTDLQTLRITLFTKKNYLRDKNTIVEILLMHGFAVTNRKFNGYDSSTGYYQNTIDVEKNYEMEEMK